MNKATLIDILAEHANLSRPQVEDVIEHLQEVIISALRREEEVTLAGFGTFSAKKRHARMGVNPLKPTERIQMPEVTVAKFKTGKHLKDALKNAHVKED
jgi:DNA-binding protein HU-beta